MKVKEIALDPYIKNREETEIRCGKKVCTGERYGE